MRKLIAAMVAVLLLLTSMAHLGQAQGFVPPKIEWSTGFPYKAMDGTVLLKGSYDLGSDYEIISTSATYFIISKAGNDIQVEREMTLVKDGGTSKTKGTFGGMGGVGFNPTSKSPWIVKIRINMKHKTMGGSYWLYSSIEQIPAAGGMGVCGPENEATYQWTQSRMTIVPTNSHKDQ